jgi:hypothetical protein
MSRKKINSVSVTIIIFLLLALYISTGCRQDLKTTVRNYKFDIEVIKKLPVYDSLANVLLRNYSSIQQHIGKSQTYYSYLPAENGNDLYKVLPEQDAVKVKEYFTQLGDTFIDGFQVFKDSTIKILIRDTYIQSDHLEVGEQLSYYPFAREIKHREFPAKDTILNKHWQYWIAFEERIF